MNLSPRNLLAWAAISLLHCWVVQLVTNSTTFNHVSLYLNPFSAFTTSSPPLTTATTISAAAAYSSSSFLNILKVRRSYYALNKTLPTPATSSDHITEIVEEAIQVVPSAFNSQSNRAVLLFGDEHDRLWDIVADVLRGHHVSKDPWESTCQKIGGFKAASGTILLFTDEAVVDSLVANIPTYASQFPVWAEHSQGMLQLALWTALELEDGLLGANLQHYNPLIDARVSEAWQVPASWRLKAQLVFGARAAAGAGVPGEKSLRPIGEKLRVFGGPSR